MRVGTDHYGALDNPATLDNPALPTVRASRFIRDPPLPRTYRHPRHWFLVCRHSGVVAHNTAETLSTKVLALRKHVGLHVPRLCGLLLSLLEVPWARASCITNFSVSSLPFCWISCFESDSTSSLYTTSTITFRTKDKLVLTSGAKQQFCRAFTTKNEQ